MHDPAPAPLDVRRHVETCPECTRYSEHLHRLHQVARLEAAPPVPDLAPAIMAKVRQERLAAPTRIDPARRRHARSRVGRRAVAAGLAAGLVVGFVLGNGGLFPTRGGGSTALASET